MTGAPGNLVRKAALLRQLMATPSCQELVKLLEAEFMYGELMATTPERTAYNLGARDVVAYLRQLQHLGDSHGSDTGQPN